MTVHIYDISITLSAETPTWPGSERFHLKWEKTIGEKGVNESSLRLNSHCGTHFDMPLHFHHEGRRIENIFLERCIGKALVIEYTGTEHIQPDFLNQIEIPSGCRKILFKTRNSYENMVVQNVFRNDHIALSPESAKWIVEKNIDLVGIDYLSIQSIEAEDNETHQILLAAETLILEGLDLRKIAGGLYMLVALPLNIPEAEAAPARAVLIEGDLW